MREWRQFAPHIVPLVAKHWTIQVAIRKQFKAIRKENQQFRVFGQTRMRGWRQFAPHIVPFYKFKSAKESGF